MNQEQIAALLRTIIQVAAGSFGWTQLQSGDTSLALASGLALVIVTVWGMYARSNKNLVASAANVPTVQKIVADPEVACAIPDPKVVPTNHPLA